MIKVISFDLDGTLVKDTYANKVWLEGVPKLYAKEKNIPLEQATKYIFEEYKKIGENRKEWYDIDWWFKKFNLTEDWKKLLKSHKETIELYPETLEVLTNLSKKYKLIIASNAKKEFIDIQIEKTKLKPYFTSVFSSLSDFDKVKKLPGFYKELCIRLNLSENELLHIGDKKEFDYESPKKIGIKSIYLNRDKSEQGRHTVYNLKEFENVLRKL